VINATQYTPEINLDPAGIFSIIGKSYPENTFEFYAPVVKWIEDYFNENPAEKTVLNIEIVYFNSSSSKLFFDIFDIFEINHDTNNIEINWIYDEENDSAKEAGEDFIEDFKGLKFNLIKKGSLE